MNMKKEIELKYRLKSKNDFDLFAHFLKPYSSGRKHIYRQENFYFDTPTLNLKRNGISLRLRKQNDEYLLCAKQSLGPKKLKKNLSVRLEYEGIINAAIAHLCRQDFLSPIDVFSTLPSKTKEEHITKKTLHTQMKKAATLGLQMIGSFVNERTVFPIHLMGQALDLDFDHSIYPKSIEVFEIEVEFPSEKHAVLIRPALEMLFHAAQIKTYQSSSKSSRLYKILRA
jgi:uncharacterized protein YjbK